MSLEEEERWGEDPCGDGGTLGTSFEVVSESPDVVGMGVWGYTSAGDERGDRFEVVVGLGRLTRWHVLQSRLVPIR